MSKHPAPFIALILLVGGLSSWYWWWHYTERIEELKASLVTCRENVQRYKMSAGIDKPDSRTALSNLTNIELKKKGHLLEKRVREIRAIHERNMHDIDPRKTGGMERWQNEINRGDRQMQEEVRVDSFLVIEELRDRLPPALRERVITTIPHIRPADAPDSPVLLWKLPLPGILIGFADQMADEIEELSKLLPDTLEKRPC